MPRILLPNLMFEDELEGTAHRVPALARKSAGQLAAVMGLLAASDTVGTSSGDIVVVDDAMIPSLIPQSLQHLRFATLRALRTTSLSEYEFQPWGWSRAAVEIGAQLGLRFSAPDTDVVRFVNCREFLAARDFCYPCGGEIKAERWPGGQLCWTMAEVAGALTNMTNAGFLRWVIKSNLSQAARNRIVGDGAKIPETTQNWLRKRFEDRQPVYVEPWFDRMTECGLQFEIPPASSSEAIRYLGGCEMLTDDAGRYRGSVVSPAEESWWTHAIPHCMKIAEAARQLGFFGPLGMDCMLYRAPRDLQLWLRPCHDVNGRITMGRVALALQRWLQPGEIGYWCHGVMKSGGNQQNLFDVQAGENVRIIPTSPARHGSESTTFQTALLISADCGHLTSVVSEILSQNIRAPFDASTVPVLCTAANEKPSP